MRKPKKVILQCAEHVEWFRAAAQEYDLEQADIVEIFTQVFDNFMEGRWNEHAEGNLVFELLRNQKLKERENIIARAGLRLLYRQLNFKMYDCVRELFALKVINGEPDLFQYAFSAFHSSDIILVSLKEPEQSFD